MPVIIYGPSTNISVFGDLNKSAVLQIVLVFSTIRIYSAQYTAQHIVI